MPNITSAKKRLRQTKVRTTRNRQYKNRIKSLTKQFNALLEEKNITQIKEHLPLLFKAIDKATKKNILHRNTASRKKSLLARRTRHVEQTAKQNTSTAE